MTTKTEERAILGESTRTQFERLTRNISAYAVAYRGEMVGKVVFIERDAGQDGTHVRCFIHILGHHMIEGEAKGGGFDIWSAAYANACENFDMDIARERSVSVHAEAFVNSARDDGQHWDGALRRRSYPVMQVV